MRFAFLRDHADLAAAKRFLTSLGVAANTREAELETFLDGDEGRALSLHGRLAVEHGVQSIQTTARWAAGALVRLSAELSGDS